MTQTYRDTALSRIREQSARLDETEIARQREIARAVHHGATWAEIADALGVTAQSAHRRYRWLRWEPVTQQVVSEPPLPLR